MFSQAELNKAVTEIQTFLFQPDAYRALLILVLSMLAAWWLSRFVAKLILKLAQVITSRTGKESSEERFIRMRQVETYLSLTIAAVRAFIVALAGYLVWSAFVPNATSGIAAIGAGTFFVVFAGQSVGMLLRDITNGMMMILERWFNVGDFIKVEPFGDVSGVVERFTLRSTKIRGLNGESIWVHNQHMMAVHVTPKALRTVEVDLFVRDRVKGEAAILEVISTLPTGPTLLAKPLRIKTAEQWNDGLWRITVVGQVPPGREWLIDKYFVESIKNLDEDKKRNARMFIHDPIARFTDPDADRRFKQAVRIDKH